MMHNTNNIHNCYVLFDETYQKSQIQRLMLFWLLLVLAFRILFFGLICFKKFKRFHSTKMTFVVSSVDDKVLVCCLCM